MTQMRIGYVVRIYVLAFGLTLVTGMAVAEENASNPLAAVNNVDLRWQYTSVDGSHPPASRCQNALSIDGPRMSLVG